MKILGKKPIKILVIFTNRVESFIFLLFIALLYKHKRRCNIWELQTPMITCMHVYGINAKPWWETLNIRWWKPSYNTIHIIIDGIVFFIFSYARDSHFYQLLRLIDYIIYYTCTCILQIKATLDLGWNIIKDAGNLFITM